MNSFDKKNGRISYVFEAVYLENTYRYVGKTKATENMPVIMMFVSVTNAVPWAVTK